LTDRAIWPISALTALAAGMVLFLVPETLERQAEPGYQAVALNET
jgi:hypothetical protein